MLKGCNSKFLSNQAQISQVGSYGFKRKNGGEIIKKVIDILELLIKIYFDLQPYNIQFL